MQTLAVFERRKLGAQIGFGRRVRGRERDARDTGSAARRAFLAAGLRSGVSIDRSSILQTPRARTARDSCARQSSGVPEDLHLPAPPCPAARCVSASLYQVLRGFPPQQVFAQTLLGFEVASKPIPTWWASTL